MGTNPPAQQSAARSMTMSSGNAVTTCDGEAADRKAPRVRVTESGQLIPEFSTNDEHDRWLRELTGTFGATDPDYAALLLTQLAGAIGKITPNNCTAINGAVSAVRDIQPKDPIEAMTAVQIIALHCRAMKMLKNAEKTSISDFEQNYLSLAMRLSRTYKALVDGLRAYRNQGQQKISVEHIYVGSGGQMAIVNGKPQERGAYA